MDGGGVPGVDMPLHSFYNTTTTSTHSIPSITEARVTMRAWWWGHYGCHCWYGSLNYEGDSRGITKYYIYIKEVLTPSFYFPHTFVLSCPRVLWSGPLKTMYNLSVREGYVYMRWWSWCFMLHITLFCWFLMC